MKAIRIYEFGGPEVLKYEEANEPVPKPGEIIVRVHAIGVNYADLLSRMGVYLQNIQFPFIPGFEVAGTVHRLGEGVTLFKEGQRVMGTIPREQSGGYAEFAAVPAWLAAPIPDHFSFEEGAAFMEVFITAYIALFVCGRVVQGEDVLIHAAAGGVGTAAVQLAKVAGAQIFATASSDEKLQRVKELGAHQTINYKEKDFAEEVKKKTSGRGVQVVVESVGGEVFQKSLECTAPLGRLVVYGVSSGEVPQLDGRTLMGRNISISGFTFGGLTKLRPDVVKAVTTKVLELAKDKKVHPIVDRVFKLSQAAEAHTLISSRKNFGKVVLVP